MPSKLALPAAEIPVTLSPMIRFASTDDVTVSDSTWQIGSPVVTLRAPGSFVAGWYRVRLRLLTPDTPAIRKRLELTFDTSAEVEVRSWNERLSDTLMIHLKEPAGELLLKLVQCTGTVRVGRFTVKRVPKAAVAMAAVREKLRLVSAYQCLRPVLWRGAGMVARGQFRTLGRKLFKGLADGKVMRPEAYRANEADAAWWRTHTLSAEAAGPIRAACDAMPNPEPIAVMIPVADGEAEYARLAAESVRRQLYPHWELFVVSSGEPVELGEWAATDERVTRSSIVGAGSVSDGEFALAKVRALCRSERVLVLPPTMELAEDALYRVVTEESLTRQPAAATLSVPERVNGGLSIRVADSSFPPRYPLEHPLSGTERGSGGEVLGPPLAFRLPTRTAAATRDLTLTAELNGINGYDAVVFALLKGLPDCGFRLLRPPSVKVRDDLLPPHLRPVVRPRTSSDWQLVVFPPFALDKFPIDRRTVVYTMWETDELLPKWVRTLNRAARVVVPSKWGAECFRACGVTVPISVVPLGYDPDVYSCEPRPQGSGNSICTFGTAGALAAGGMRKNAQHLIDLFRQAFPMETDVRLRVKLSPTSPAIGSYADPRIDVLRASLPHRELADWYRSLTAYVNGSFGEGFGLHLIEAMACGRPLITPNVTGLTEFFTPDCGYVVGSKPVPVKNDIYQGSWHRPCNDGIIAAMRRVYTDRAEVEMLGTRAAQRAKAFTWENCCAGLAEVVTSPS